MSSYASPSPSLEALLRNACHRALRLGLSFTNQLRVYRSIIALAREVRLRFGNPLCEAGNDTLPTLLAAVCDHASELGLDRELPLPDAILVQRLAVRLSRATRMAAGAEPAGRRIPAQTPVQRENTTQPDAPEPAATDSPAQNPLQREKPAQPDAPEPPDDRLSAWRNDHTTERDQRAHEKLRTVIDARLIAKVKAMNKRDREEWGAAEQTEAA